MSDMNLPKLTTEDTPLFLGILNDLFPGVEAPKQPDSTIRQAILESFTSKKLQMQLHDTKLTRHSVMLVGDTGVGKSVCWNILKDSYCNLHKLHPNQFSQVLAYQTKVVIKSG
ncbi:Dynein heavy chain 2, axonemal [Coelomomyces lativittatus]|nr:Dynein heavy chain 2, axonemal [Coelomomyces lativittatus]